MLGQKRANWILLERTCLGLSGLASVTGMKEEAQRGWFLAFQKLTASFLGLDSIHFQKPFPCLGSHILLFVAERTVLKQEEW